MTLTVEVQGPLTSWENLASYHSEFAVEALDGTKGSLFKCLQMFWVTVASCPSHSASWGGYNVLSKLAGGAHNWGRQVQLLGANVLLPLKVGSHNKVKVCVSLYQHCPSGHINLSVQHGCHIGHVKKAVFPR